MHTWLATGLMGRVIRSRRTLALVAVLAVLTCALGAAFAQQGQAAPPSSQVAALAARPTRNRSRNPAKPGEANLKLPDMKSVFLNGITGQAVEIGLVFADGLLLD